MHIIQTNGKKYLKSSDENYIFDQNTGEMITWGKSKADDAKYSKFGPYILDIEISEKCSGIPDVGSDIPISCRHCYKSNVKVGREMSFDTFKTIFDKLPKTLTQVAFGIGDTSGPKDFVKFLDYCRNNEHNPNVVPNLTINGWGLTDELVAMFKKYLGGIAVSRYKNKDVCYDAVKKLTDAGITQTNIHQVLAVESLLSCYDLIDDVVSDPRLSKLKAVVFLTLKPKGKRNTWSTLTDVDAYRDLILYAFARNVGIGFDSCSQPIFLAAMKDHPNFEVFSQLSEGCESDRFSGYVNVDGIWSHCSFTEGIQNWGTVDLKTITDFNSEVWNSDVVKKFRGCLTCQDNKHIGNEVYLCPVYQLYSESIGNADSAIVKSDRKTIVVKEMK